MSILIKRGPFRANQPFVLGIGDTRGNTALKWVHRYYIYFVCLQRRSCAAAEWSRKNERNGCRRGQNIAPPSEFNEGQRYRSTSDVPMGKYRDSSTLRRVCQFPRSLGGYLFSLLLPVMHLIPYPFTALRRLILIIFPSLSARPRVSGVPAICSTNVINFENCTLKSSYFSCDNHVYDSHRCFYPVQRNNKCHTVIYLIRKRSIRNYILFSYYYY